MGKQNISILELSLVAAGVVTQYRGVDFTGAQIAAQGAKIAGIAKFGAAAAGDDLTVWAKGTAVIEAGAAINKGDSLIMDNQGRAIPSTGKLAIAAGAVAVTSVAANGANDITGGDSPEQVIGDAMEAAAAAGDFIEVLLR